MKGYFVFACVTGIVLVADSVATAGPILPHAVSPCTSGTGPLPGPGPGILQLPPQSGPAQGPWCASESASQVVLYRVRNNGVESGIFRDSYSALLPDAIDTLLPGAPTPGGVIIGFDGGRAITCTGCYVTVSIRQNLAAGIQAPNVSAFDPGDWNGVDSLYVSAYLPHYARSTTYTIWGVRSSPRAVPEPATVLLLGAGLAGALAVRRRRFR